MVNISATLFRARSSRACSVSLSFSQNNCLIETENYTETIPIVDIRFRPGIGSSPHELSLPDGGLLSVPSKVELSPYWPRIAGDSLLTRFERSPIAWLFALVFIPFSLYVLINHVIPTAAKAVTPYVPQVMKAHIDNQALFVLDNSFLEPSLLTDEQKRSVNAIWSSTIKTVEQGESEFQLLFRQAGNFGANAFALPGGTVVVTDELVTLLSENPDALKGVFFHEIGHVKHQHSLQLISESAGTTLLLTYLFGDLEGAADLFVGSALTVIQNQFSQAFESEADSYAKYKLEQQGISATALADALLLIVGEQEASNSNKLSQYFSSHPSIKQRVEALK